MNADEQIYLRYGGRDSRSAMAYLNLRSLELALEKGLELHADPDWTPVDRRPEKLVPRDIPLLADRTIRRNACVECHLIADYRTIALEKTGELNRQRDLHVSPDIRKIGLELDVPRGLVIGRATGAAKTAGVQVGDTIRALNGKPVHTFGDLQYRYGKVNRMARSIDLSIVRAGREKRVTLGLPQFWWLTETGYRYWTVEAVLPFASTPLSDDEKKKRSLPREGFASRITDIDSFDDSAEPSLEKGDLLLAVNDVETDELAKTVDLHVRLRYSSGTRVKLLVERNGKRFVSRLTTFRQSFRKPSIARADFSHQGSTPKKEVSFRAELVEDYLVIWANPAKGWHTFAMDNERRARQAAGDRRLLGVEQGLSISLSGGMKPVSGWRQSMPREFSNLGQSWFSFGFDEQSCFACRVESVEATDLMIHIRGQACDSKTCRPVDVRLRIAQVRGRSEAFDFDSLIRVDHEK